MVTLGTSCRSGLACLLVSPLSLIDAAVRVQGVCVPKWNDRNQIVAIRIVTTSRNQLQVLQAAPTDPFAIPVSALADLMGYNPEGSGLGAMSHRVKVRGVVSFPTDSLIFLQDDRSGARIELSKPFPAQPGDLLEAVGFAKTFGFSPMLTDCALRRVGATNLPSPIVANVETLFNLTRIFNHGFTTRKDGHGFGLHSGALAARELGGALRVHSDGLGQGATFTVELPLTPPTS